MNNWKNIWNNKILNMDKSAKSILQMLIEIDGFNTGYGSISEEAWLKYISYVEDRLNLNKSKSIYEVGCGAGAFLYPFYQKGYTLGGIDYSDSLINLANKNMIGTFEAGEATNITDTHRYDIVISNSVFFYFPTYDYAEKVLSIMVKKATQSIAVLEVSDLDKRDEALRIRKGHMSEAEYQERYDGLEHLYYDKNWFIEMAYKYNCDIKIEEQHIDGYANSAYRYNVFLEKR